MCNRSGIDSRDMLSRQVRSLQLQLSELELRADWHLRRVHELEAYLGGRVFTAGGAHRPPTDTPVHLRGGTNDASNHPHCLADDDRQRIRWLERQLKARDVDLRQKEIAISELTAAVQQGHGLLEQVSAEAALLREASEQLTAQLHAKDREIAELAATANERLRLVEQQVLAVEEKERMIVDLAATAEARLRLIEDLDAAVARANEALNIRLTER